jgi:hypothetical protein
MDVIYLREQKIRDGDRVGLETAMFRTVGRGNPHPEEFGYDADFTAARVRTEDKVIAASYLPVDSKARDDAFAMALQLLRGTMFKSDRPYKTRLGYHNNLSTNGSGVLNSVVNVSSITSVIEWATLVALFDEVFVHSMTMRYYPFNMDGTTPFASAAVASQAVETTLSGGIGVANCGLIMACFMSAAGTLTTASALIANPNHKLAHSSKPWKYVWRNVTRFDRHGPSFSSASNTGWMGWTFVSDANFLGGFIQVRTINDQAIGTGGVVNTLGTLQIEFDISFRSRV